MVRRLSEDMVKGILGICAIFSIIIIFLIIIFLFREGLEAFSYTNVIDFVLGREWNPSKETFGAAAFIVSSLFVTVGAIIIAVPVGLLTAIFLAELSPQRVREVVKPAIELLAGIPSVIYGLFGLIVIVKYIRITLDQPTGESILAGSIILAIMILPTIIRTSEEALLTVPRAYREGSLSLGATKWYTIFNVVLPNAMPGIVTGIVLSVGRIIAETAIFWVTLGGSYHLPMTVMNSGRSMALHVYMLASETRAFDKAMGTASILIIIIILLNLSINILSRRLTARMNGKK